MANKTTIVGSSPIPPSSYPPPHVHVASGTAIAKSIFLVAIVIKIFSSGDLFRNSHPDPRTVAHRGRYDDDGPLLAIPASRLDELKYREPTVNYHRRSDSSSVRRGTVLDVLSIGSMTRIEYLTAQVNTWASHVDVRNFWGFTERDDYDPNCAIAMGDRSALASFVKTCRSPTLWHHRADAGGEGGGGQGTKSDRMFDRMFKNFERLRVKTYGLSSWNDTNGHNSGWYCAQRRHGRALGWLRAAYQNSTTMPDFLLIVDDDTSLDIEKVKRLMQESTTDNDIPFVGASCTFIMGINIAFGGFGTFLNMASIERMSIPIFCDSERQRESPYVESVCSNLLRNRAGELAVFREGDSVLDIFYKYSALNKFCMHSDWMLGYMIGFYSALSMIEIFRTLVATDGLLLSYCPTFDNRAVHETTDMAERIRNGVGQMRETKAYWACRRHCLCRAHHLSNVGR